MKDVKKECKLYDSIYVKFWETQTKAYPKAAVFAWGWGRHAGDGEISVWGDTKGTLVITSVITRDSREGLTSRRRLRGEIYMFIFLVVVWVSHVYTDVIIYQIEHFHPVQLYLNIYCIKYF